ncbi:MAG: metallophosphoesterase [Candidatus Aenigmatarchaeota archaeon]
MEIFEGIFTVNGFRAIFLEKLRAVAISDLQLGEELYLAEQGIFVPQVQLKEMKEDLKEILKETEAEKIIINGDLKHEFGSASQQEWREVKELISFLREKVKEIILVRGNHDNYLLNIISKLEVKLFQPFFFSQGILFAHGHKKIEYPKGMEVLIIGHEQPSLVLRKGFDKVKVPCLLYGRMKNEKNFICLPAFSPLASGVEINVISKEDLLSPILKEEVDLENLFAVALDKEAGALNFGKIKDLRVEV